MADQELSERTDHLILTEGASVDISHAITYSSAILKKLEIRQPPTNLEKIAQSMNVKIVKEDLDGDGYTIPLSNGKGLILCKNYGNERNFRWRFTLAHELGHWLLSKLQESQGSNVVETSYENEERWCDTFAVNLLIPSEWFNKKIKPKLTNLSLDYQAMMGLANEFMVSEETFRNRLWDLGMLRSVEVKIVNGKLVQDVGGLTVPKYSDPSTLIESYEKEILQNLKKIERKDVKISFGPFIFNANKRKESVLFILTS